jgi:hypothetical protein
MKMSFNNITKIQGKSREALVRFQTTQFANCCGVAVAVLNILL